ncbi:hypothetical protein [Muricoccus aerilatus]|uniref:hypothetical protein n=1 Tax=Muricoccus aerilatus TaxID=452982 RepID=UPI0005C1996D|nr:hypothetical protein [Roseomonas aerilata]
MAALRSMDLLVPNLAAEQLLHAEPGAQRHHALPATPSMVECNTYPNFSIPPRIQSLSRP